MLRPVQTILPGLEIEALHPAVDAELTAGGADDDPILDHEGSHRRRLALAEVGDLGLPELFAARRVYGDRMPVEQVVDDLPVGVEGTAVDHVAAGLPDRVGAHGRTVLPLERIALLGEIEGVETLGHGVTTYIVFFTTSG
jgi:hypothetical protein